MPSRHLPWVEFCLVVALVQIVWAGYRFGTGNQAIQLVFLQHLLDPGSFANDALIRTLPAYPTAFFRLLARVLSPGTVEPAYFALYALTVLATALGVFCLSRAMFRQTAAAVIGLLILAAGHHQGLAGAPLYWQTFTHTGVGQALAVFCLALYFAGRLPAALALAGVLFSVHALQGAYVAAMLALGLVVEARDLGWKRAAAGVALFCALAAPVLCPLLAQSASWDEMWVRLVRIRSAAHSFPLTWWQPGQFEIPRFLLAAALGVFGLGFGMPHATRRRIKVIMAASLALFAVGVAGSALVPVPVVLRAQVFRASALLLLVLLLTAAHGAVAAWQAARATRGRWSDRAWAWGSAAASGFACVVLAEPGFAGGWTLAVGLAAVTALGRGGLSPSVAAVGGAAWLVAAWGAAALRFPFLAWPTGFGAGHRLLSSPECRAILLLLTAAVLCLRLRDLWWIRWGARAGFVLAGGAVLFRFYATTVAAQDDDDPWVQAQRWARLHTPKGAIFLTPPAPGGFRVHSGRSVVAEWRDGTQGYFDPVYAGDWWKRMRVLAPASVGEAGPDLGDLSDGELGALAARFGATYLVLPDNADRDFVPCWANGTWAIYRNERRVPPPAPPDAVDGAVWQAQEAFLASTVKPNIERYRKSDVSLQVVDREGRPLRGVSFSVRQVDSLFGFGSAIGYFSRPPDWRSSEQSAYVVDSRELEKFAEVFNFSVTGYSGKWAAMEPREGQVYTDDLDRYTAWCRDHRVRVQLHFVTGYEPDWLKALSPPEQEARLVARTRGLADRYGKAIDTWQVMNEKHLYAQAPAAFKALRERLPQARLGISDCAVFWAPHLAAKRGRAMQRGLVEQVEALRRQGVAVDFVGLHGHRPFGLWADLRDVYELFDVFAKEGVRVYVTEFAVPSDGRIEGPVRSGKWTETLQADYYEMMFKVCFSHPAVDGINLWGVGPNTFVGGAGLLDREYRPKPAFDRLKTLIRDTWRTRLDGTLGVDGGVDFRGFQGDYECVLTLGGGGQVTVPFRVACGPATRLRVTVDIDRGTATVGGAP